MSVFSDLWSLTYSSFSCDGQNALWVQFFADTFSHVGIAAMIATCVFWRGKSVVWLWLVLAAVVLKEMSFDLRHAGWAWMVVWDSIWDVFSWFFGMFIMAGWLTIYEDARQFLARGGVVA